jgi:hypothetical protein
MNPTQAVQAGSQKYHEVFVNDVSTHRKFTSLLAAKRYSDAVKGTIRTTG